VVGVDRAPTGEELKELEATLPDQPLHLAIAVCGDRVPASWWGAAEHACWADAVEAARAVGRALGADPKKTYADDVCDKYGLPSDQWCFDTVRQRPVGAIGQQLIEWINRPTFQQAVEVKKKAPR